MPQPPSNAARRRTNKTHAASSERPDAIIHFSAHVVHAIFDACERIKGPFSSNLSFECCPMQPAHPRVW
eukprot:6700806-Prymnesium_polylepis.1